MARRAFRIGAFGAAAALAMGGVFLAAPAHAAEGVGVSFLGHICGPDNVGPEPTCTYVPTVNHSYGGTGPFTITAVDSAGTTVLSVNCASGALCTDDGAGTIPAGSTVTIEVTAEPGGVTAGALQ
ncbi:MAG: hypothetical protein ACRDQ7_10705 [Haloechinothrix sp.]